ncbi:MAG: glycoside hydrolase family 5 protein [Kiritimatiellia bacterium]
MRTMMTLLAAALAFAACAENLVPADKRAFDVPFKGAGKMGLVYQPVFFPKGTEGAVVSAEVRIEGVEKGDKPWFDARIMMDFITAECKKVKGGPALGGWKGTKDWFPVRKTVRIPDGAAGLALMPCLFNVKSGAMSVRSLSVEPQEKFVEDSEERARREAGEKKRAASLEQRRLRAAKALAEGALIPPVKDGAPYARLVAARPGRLVNHYREYDLPANVEALKMSWRWEVRNLKTGVKPWFDARVILKFKDADGKELKAPAPVYTQRNTPGFVAHSTSFLVPAEAMTLVVMPCLFQVTSGEMEIRDVTLVPTDPQPLREAAAAHERQIRARHVPDEPENRSRWPMMVRVQGNRLVDPEGREVWLQGVNAGGMETIPDGEQETKSTVVAIDVWKSNCIRLPINEAHWFGTGVYSKPDGGASFRAACDKIVRLAANRGAYVVIDLHRFRAPKAEHVAFWRDCAAHYMNHPAVLFDLFNEPHGVSWEVWRNGGWVGEADTVDESAFLSAEEKRKNQGFESVGMQALVDAVRSTGAKNVVIAGGLFWANDLTGIESEAIEKGEKPSYRLEDKTGNGIMYAWHAYHWHKGWNRILPVAARHPVFLGEVGAAPRGVMNFIPDEDQEDPYTFVPDMLGFIQKYRLNWTGWCFHPKAAPVMITSWDYEPTPYWGEFARRALRGEPFEMKRMR